MTDNSNLSTYTYTVNAIGQRTAVAQSGSAFAAASQIDWSYDPLGQLTSADHSEGPKARAYAYDSIGNRTTAQTGNARIADPATAGTTTYTANPLNQYTTIQQGCDGVSPSFDPDGNATAYPLPTDPTQNATLTWDAENRLVKVATPTNGTIDYQYDYLSRRIIRSETANGLTSTRHYLYDGWNCLAEHDKTASFPTVLSKTYLWGLDRSGSLQGAGGVGGLLTQFNHAANDPSAVTAFYPTYDGNGNVSEYLSESGAIVEHNEYDPFGNLTTGGGSVSSFTYRFSTKPIDPLTGLYYYGYRYYDPVTGRWPSRDPIGERGGTNLYGFVGNDGIGKVDVLGRQIFGGDYPSIFDNFGDPPTGTDSLQDFFDTYKPEVESQINTYVKTSVLSVIDCPGKSPDSVDLAPIEIGVTDGALAFIVGDAVGRVRVTFHANPMAIIWSEMDFGSFAYHFANWSVTAKVWNTYGAGNGWEEALQPVLGPGTTVQVAEFEINGSYKCCVDDEY